MNVLFNFHFFKSGLNYDCLLDLGINLNNLLNLFDSLDGLWRWFLGLYRWFWDMHRLGLWLLWFRLFFWFYCIFCVGLRFDFKFGRVLLGFDFTELTQSGGGLLN